MTPMLETLSEKGKGLGVSRQAVWQKTSKGKAYKKAYKKAYQKTDKYKAYRRKVYQKKRPKCLSCGKNLISVKDPISKKYTGHIFRCVCMPPHTSISIG
jgi:predicted DNA-binding protein YlxM (UPF0122 family)